jgi:uncharacterized membrane protein YqjE
MDRTNARALQRVFLALLAGIAVSWAGVVALMALSVLWPRNHIPQILLATWVLAAVASVAMAWPQDEKQAGPSKGALLVLAPFYPLLRAGQACHSAWTARRR